MPNTDLTLFVSYHHFDYHLAEMFSYILASSGLSVLPVNERTSLTQYREAHPAATLAVVVLLRPEYLSTEYTLKELRDCEQHTLLTFPILISPIHLGAWFAFGVEWIPEKILDLTNYQITDKHYISNVTGKLFQQLQHLRSKSSEVIPIEFITANLQCLDRLRIFSTYELALLTLNSQTLNERPITSDILDFSEYLEYSTASESDSYILDRSQAQSFGLYDILNIAPRIGLVHSTRTESQLLLDLVLQMLMLQRLRTKESGLPVRVHVKEINNDFFKKLQKTGENQVTLIVDGIDEANPEVVRAVASWLRESSEHRIIAATTSHSSQLNDLHITHVHVDDRSAFSESFSLVNHCISANIFRGIAIKYGAEAYLSNIVTLLQHVHDKLIQYFISESPQLDKGALYVNLASIAFHQVSFSSHSYHLSDAHKDFAARTGILFRDGTSFSNCCLLSFYAASSDQCNLILDAVTPPEFFPDGQRKQSRHDLSLLFHIHCVQHAEAQVFVGRLASIDPFLALECLLNLPNYDHTIYDSTLNQCIQHPNMGFEAHIWLARLLWQRDTDTAIRIISEVTKHGTDYQRRIALQILESTDQVFLVDALATSDIDLTDQELEPIIAILRKMHSTALPALIHGIRSNIFAVRVRAMWILGQLKLQESIPELIKILDDSDPEIVKAGIHALSQFKNQIVLDALSQRMTFGTWGIRKLAATILLQLESNVPGNLSSSYTVSDEETRQIVQYTIKENNNTQKRTKTTGQPLLPRNSLSRWYRNRMHSNSRLKSVSQRDGRDIQSSTFVKDRLVSSINNTPNITELTSSSRNPLTALTDMANQLRSASSPSQRIKIIKSIQLIDNNSDLITTLLETTQDENLDVSEAALAILKLRIKAPCPQLVDLLHMPADANLRAVIIDVIQSVQDKSAINALTDCLSDHRRLLLSDETVSDKAADALRILNVSQTSFDTVSSGSQLTNVGDNRSELQTIFGGLLDPDWINNSEAAKSLQSFAKLSQTSDLAQDSSNILDYVEHSDWKIRYSVIEAIAWMHDESAEEKLINRLHDENRKVQVAAIRALAELKSFKSIEILETLLDSETAFIREAVAEALGVIGSSQVVHALIKASTDHEEFVRLAAVDALGKINQKETIGALLQALRDQNIHVRWAAANALYNLDTDDITAELSEFLHDCSGPYWEQKRICDVIAEKLEFIGTDKAKSTLSNWRRGLLIQENATQVTSS
jgi:HEAT repeat protein